MSDLTDIPPNAWTRLANIAALFLPILAKKKSSFDLGGYVNKQNCHIWGTETPHAYIEKPTHPKRLTVCYGFWSRGIIGQFFFENEQGEAVTVNGDCYRAMLNEFLFTKIEEVDMGNRTTLHATQPKLHSMFLCLVFEDRIISRRVDIVWPPRSCDLTLLDYYLWGAVKPETIDALKDNTREVIGEIQLHTIDNVLKNWTDRVYYCMASWGSHLNEIIFHY